MSCSFSTRVKLTLAYNEKMKLLDLERSGLVFFISFLLKAPESSPIFVTKECVFSVSARFQTSSHCRNVFEYTKVDKPTIFLKSPGEIMKQHYWGLEWFTYIGPLFCKEAKT